MSQQARVRRLQDTLTSVGGGVIAFGAWTVAKTLLLFLLFDEETQRQTFGISTDLPLQIYYIAFAFVAIIDLSIRLYVGMSARAEGRGKRKGIGYLVFATLMMMASVASVMLVVLGMESSPSIFDLIMSVIIEATSATTLALMIICAVRLRRLNRVTE